MVPVRYGRQGKLSDESLTLIGLAAHRNLDVCEDESLWCHSLETATRLSDSLGLYGQASRAISTG